jgi:hypothetical protein
LHSKADTTFIKIDYTVGYKINLSKFQVIEIIQNMFSDRSRKEPEINTNKTARKIAKDF